MPVTVEEYRARLAERLVEEAPTLEAFRQRWVLPTVRHTLLTRMPDEGRSPDLLRALLRMEAFDLYDVLAEIGYGLSPRTRDNRADAFTYKHKEWLDAMPAATAATIRALTRQFAQSGTEGLENPSVLMTPGVRAAGGLAALKALGDPKDVLQETKERMFAV